MKPIAARGEVPLSGPSNLRPVAPRAEVLASRKARRMTLEERNRRHVALIRRYFENRRREQYGGQILTPGRYWTNHEQARALEMRARGLTYEQIGKAIGRNANAVAARLRYIRMLARCGHGTRVSPVAMPRKTPASKPAAPLFERQMQALRNGAKLVDKFVPRKADYPFTLAGVSEIA